MTSVTDDSTACGGQCATAAHVSVIVPVWHDAQALERLLTAEAAASEEWIVVNGDPDDQTLQPIRARFPAVTWLDAPRGRGPQMNAGAARASGAWLLFLHADTRLPARWRDELARVQAAGDARWGCFRFGLDSNAWQARLIEYGVALRVRLLRLPYGDQGLFVRRDVFDAVGGFPAIPLMEDVALVRRLSGESPPWRSSLVARTSARRWQRDGWWRRSALNVSLLVRYWWGVPPERLAARYERRQGHN